MKFLKKHWSNLLFLVAIALLVLPQTRVPIQAFVQRLIAWSPSEIASEDRITLNDYRWSLRSLSAEEINFSVSEGSVVLINFWATWCPPCIAEMPSLQQLYDRYGDRVDFYFVTDEKISVVTQFLQKKGYKLPVYITNSTPPEALQTRSLPTTILISKEGNIVMRKEGAANWNASKVHAAIAALLAE